MKKFFLFIILLAEIFIINGTAVMSQVSITTDGSNPDQSAMLEIKSDSKGLLLPRVDYNNLPASPAEGLLVYVVANAPYGNGLYLFDGTSWLKLTAAGNSIGMYANGGVIFYVDPTGLHGLVAAPADQGQAAYSCDTVLIGPDAQHFGLGEGDLNTTAIVAHCVDSTTVHAALMCDTLSLNGYTDWYLPAQDELDSLMHHKEVIPGLVNFDWYWTSTEWDYGNALFIPNDPSYTPYWICSKFYSFLKVRCVRKF